MKLKLDENLGRRVEAVLRSAGHDAETVPGERLSGSADRVIFAKCLDEGRALVTMDLDFANVLAASTS